MNPYDIHLFSFGYGHLVLKIFVVKCFTLENILIYRKTSFTNNVTDVFAKYVALKESQFHISCTNKQSGTYSISKL